jgi:hypothetical protein
VTLLGIGVNPADGALVVRYEAAAASRDVPVPAQPDPRSLPKAGKVLAPNELPLLTLRFSDFELGFVSSDVSPSGLRRYTTKTVRAGTKEAVTYCRDSAGKKTPVTFLPGRTVDAVSARVTAEPSAVTMACGSGAIATCLDWNYRPPAISDDLYGACLQAKRAAYFARSGDYRSYTYAGTEIALRDDFVNKGGPLGRLEAVWKRDGAECLIDANLRHYHEFRNDRAFVQRVAKMNRCPDSGAAWSQWGNLATGLPIPAPKP